MDSLVIHLKEYSASSGALLTLISSVLGILVAGVTIVAFVSESLRQILGRKKKISGVYVTIATEFQTNQRFIHDIMKIRRSPLGYVGKTIHLIDKKRNQKLRFKLEYGTEVYKGTWKNVDDRTSGYLKLSYYHDDKILHGIWIGESNKSLVNGGEWIFIKLRDFQNARSLKKFLESETKEGTNQNPDRLTAIKKKHTDFGKDHFEHGELQFTVNSDVFIPPLGKVSIRLIEQAESILRKSVPSSVLDIGCGIGFYALLFKKMGVKKVVGIDINATAIDIATQNAYSNNMELSEGLKFLRSDRMFNDLNPRTDKFELIIANLPFTASEDGHTFNPTNYDSMFCSNKETLQEFIFGCQQFITDDGMVLFTFGTSGHIDYLNKLIGLTVFDKQLLMTVQEKDETFYVYKLSINEKSKKYRFNKPG